DISNAQGGMERIKNTPLPQQYATYPEIFTHGFCLLLPLGLVETLGLYTPLGSTVAGFLFLALLQIGNDMQNPFENLEDDVPLTTLTRAIEIDLRDGLGEKHGLEPVKPQDGILCGERFRMLANTLGQVGQGDEVFHFRRLVLPEFDGHLATEALQARIGATGHAFGGQPAKHRLAQQRQHATHAEGGQHRRRRQHGAGQQRVACHQAKGDVQGKLEQVQDDLIGRARGDHALLAQPVAQVEAVEEQAHGTGQPRHEARAQPDHPEHPRRWRAPCDRRRRPAPEHGQVGQQEQADQQFRIDRTHMPQQPRAQAGARQRERHEPADDAPLHMAQEQADPRHRTHRAAHRQRHGHLGHRQANTQDRHQHEPRPTATDGTDGEGGERGDENEGEEHRVKAGRPETTGSSGRPLRGTFDDRRPLGAGSSTGMTHGTGQRSCIGFQSRQIQPFVEKPLRPLRPLVLASALLPALAGATDGPASLVNPLIGTANGGDVFPGAVVPFGMLQFSPEESPLPGRKVPIASAGGYEHRGDTIRGFSLTNVEGWGCAGASGDVPIMPVTEAVTASPSKDFRHTYTSTFSHANEQARAGHYRVAMDNGVTVDLTAALHSGAARFAFPAGKPVNVLVRASDSEMGSEKATVQVDATQRRISGEVTSGNFCGYINEADRRSYYTLHYVIEFDQPFASNGTWKDGNVTQGSKQSEGGTGYGEKGIPDTGKGSGAWVGFAPGTKEVNLRVGISYVSAANAQANLDAEAPKGTGFDALRDKAVAAWNRQLSHIDIEGGTPDQRTVFYTALYHASMTPNVFSDVNGEYMGFDDKVHRVAGTQKAQYANFSGWDVYRSQLPLVAWLEPKIASDIAQSLYNQAQQNHGVWDRWTHNNGATHVMNGDP
ncbi:hypothetical protein KCV01_g17907, partial [Aureobasidium melanogenum]